MIHINIIDSQPPHHASTTPPSLPHHAPTTNYIRPPNTPHRDLYTSTSQCGAHIPHHDLYTPPPHHIRSQVNKKLQLSPVTLMGTVAYQSPEQLTGKNISFPADIYAFGLRRLPQFYLLGHPFNNYAY